MGDLPASCHSPSATAPFPFTTCLRPSPHRPPPPHCLHSRTDHPQLLLNLSERAQLRTRMNAMFGGEHINGTEDRAVLHTALRAPRDVVRRAGGGQAERSSMSCALDAA